MGSPAGSLIPLDAASARLVSLPAAPQTRLLLRISSPRARGRHAQPPTRGPAGLSISYFRRVTCPSRYKYPHFSNESPPLSFLTPVLSVHLSPLTSHLTYPSSRTLAWECSRVAGKCPPTSRWPMWTLTSTPATTMRMMSRWTAIPAPTPTLRPLLLIRPPTLHRPLLIRLQTRNRAMVPPTATPTPPPSRRPRHMAKPCHPA